MYFAVDGGILHQNESPFPRGGAGCPMPADRRRTISVYVSDKEYAGLEELRAGLGIKVSMSALAQFSLRKFLERYKNNQAQLLLDFNLRPVSDENSEKLQIYSPRNGEEQQ